LNKLEGITVRDAARPDLAAILGLLRAAFAEYEGFLDPPSGAHDETLGTVGRRMARGGAVMAIVDDVPVGCAFYEAVDGLLYFGRLSVLPDFRRRGIGTALLDSVEQRARNTGAGGVRLGVRLQLPHLLTRYERLGYRITKCMTHAGYENPTYAFMEKRF
jgi:GNAT superfamily N-acetyltransferase